MLLCLVLTPVFAQQSMWLETDTQTEIKMSLRLQKKTTKLVEVQENAVEALSLSQLSQENPHNHLPCLHNDTLP